MYDRVVEYISNVSRGYREDLSKYETRVKIYYLVNGFIDALNLNHTDLIYISCKLVDFLNYDRRSNHV